MTKVSVIVAAYCSGDGLDRVVASLDAQSLPQDEFESIFVDDGSPDDTLERLRALAASRPNMRVTSIPNSGWPCRPRNVGIEMAVGEYVTFMDHDDELYPDALRDAYAFAVENDADVVNTRESFTRGWYWGFRHQRDDRTVAPMDDPESLMPMRPHKLYRRGLLDEHGIRFVEGRRVIYEDIYFNLEVLARARRVSVLSSRPFYKWVAHGENNSGTYGKDAQETWGAFEEIFRMLEQLDLEPSAREFLLLHTYQLRVLQMMLGPGLLGRDDEWLSHTFETVPDFLARHVPERFDHLVSALARPRAFLARHGRFDLVRPLAEVDRGLSAAVTARDVGWTSDGALHLTGDAVWTIADGSPWLVRGDDGRVLRVVPRELAGALPDDTLDVTSALESGLAALTVKSREDSSDWVLAAATHTVELEDVPGGQAVRVRVDSRTPVDRAVFDRPLGAGVWDVGGRIEMFGHDAHAAVRYDGPARPGLLAGRVAVVAADKRGRLTVRMDAALHEVLECTRPAVNEGTARRLGLRGVAVSVPVHGVAVAGESRLPLLALLRPLGGGDPVEVPAVLVADGAGARLELRAPRLAAGRYRLVVDTSGDDGPGRRFLTPAVVTRTRTGRAGLERVPVKGRKKRVWGRGVDLPVGVPSAPSPDGAAVTDGAPGAAVPAGATQGGSGA